MGEGDGGGEAHVFLLPPRWADGDSAFPTWTRVVGEHRTRGPGQKQSHLAGFQNWTLTIKLHAHCLLRVCHMAGSGDPEMVRTPASS